MPLECPSADPTMSLDPEVERRDLQAMNKEQAWYVSYNYSDKALRREMRLIFLSGVYVCISYVEEGPLQLGPVQGDWRRQPNTWQRRGQVRYGTVRSTNAAQNGPRMSLIFA